MAHAEALKTWAVPSDARRCGAVIFGSSREGGRVSDQRIVAFAVRDMAEARVSPEERVVAAVGAGLRPFLRRARLPVFSEMSLPQAPSDIPGFAREALVQLQMWRAAQGLGRMFLYYHRASSSSFDRAPVRTALWDACEGAGPSTWAAVRECLRGACEEAVAAELLPGRFGEDEALVSSS